MSWLDYWELRRDPFGTEEPISYLDDSIGDIVIENQAIKRFADILRFADREN